MKRRSKRVATIVVLAGVAILAVTGVVYRRQINIQWWLWRLRADHEGSWKGAVRALEGMPPRGAVRLLIQQFPDYEEAALILGDHSPEDVGKLQLVQAVSAFGVVAVPDLIECLDDEKIIYAEGSLRLVGKDAIPLLIQATTGKRPSVRLHSVRVLGEVGRRSNVVIDALILALRDEEWFVRQNAALALMEAAMNSPSLATVAVPALQATLKDPNPDVRHAVGVALKLLSPSARRKR